MALLILLCPASKRGADLVFCKKQGCVIFCKRCKGPGTAWLLGLGSERRHLNQGCSLLPQASVRHSVCASRRLLWFAQNNSDGSGGRGEGL